MMIKNQIDLGSDLLSVPTIGALRQAPGEREVVAFSNQQLRSS
jgi:hypothetical protein